MTTNMNFGPEWMRGNLSKHNNINSNDFASTDILDSLMPFDDNNNNQQHQQQSQQENPFKYSKEFMLGLFKPALQLPSDFKQHEYVTMEGCTAPLAFEELTDAEKKLLSGPVHSEVSSRKSQRHRGGNDLYSSPMQSPASENGPTTPGGSRLGQRKGRNDYFAKDQASKRGDSSDLLRRRDHSEDMNLSLGKADDEGKEPSWAISEGSGLGNFGGGLGNDAPAFKSDALFGGSNVATTTAAVPPPSSELSGLNSSSNVRKPEEIKWFYRDPSGQVQGPFEAQEMQDWYKAGFFTPTLMLRRDDETVFEPLMVLTQKVGNEDQPFLAPRATRLPTGLTNVDMFGSPEKGANLFRNGPDLQSKYMPFGSASAAPTTPGGSIRDSFLGGGMPSNPIYQSPYNNNFGSSLLRDNRWNSANDSQPQASPSWLNPTTPELFGNNSLASPFMGQQQPGLNPMFGSNMNSPGLFDYQRSAMDPMDQHQQYNMMLQQKQQQQSMQFQQQFHQMQFQQDQQQQQQQQFPAQQQQLPLQQQQQQQQQSIQQQPSQIPQAQSPQQNTFKNTPLENISSINTGIIGSNHASPVMRSNILTGGWGSAPGTPLGNEPPSSPWGSIVSTAIPNKVSEELQAKAPGAQSPRTPSSPTKKPIEKPVKAKTIVESFADIQLAEEKKAADAKAIADAKLAAEAKVAAIAEKTANLAPASTTTTTTTTTTSNTTADISPKAVPTTPAAVSKPVVSLREIQEEELRIANLKKAKAKQAVPSTVTTPSWAASNNTPLSSTTNGTWSQPAHKPLSLREIQEMEAKQAAETKKASAAQYLAQQEQLANATPSTLSWGVVVPNSKSSSSNTPSASPSVSNAAAWTAPTGPKKTLREIQLEEELAMKKKNAKATKSAAAIAAANATTNSSSSSKAYAATPSAGGAWTTVTNTRATKPSPAPTPAAVTPPPPQPTQWTPVKAPTRTAASPARSSGPSEEFRRWCRKALRDLNSGVNQDEIVSMLLSFPADSSAAEIIEDVIYANSLRIDGKRFAQEFMKRRKADIAGRLDIVTAGLEDEDDDDFKVVVTKKGKKKQSS